MNIRPSARGLLIVGFSASYVAIDALLPFVTTETFLQSASAVFAAVFTLLWLFFSRMVAVTGVGQLSGREMERYVAHRTDMRSRFWLLVLLTIGCSGCLWLLATSPYAQNARWLPLAAGFLIGSGISFLLVAWRWIDELMAFADGLQLKEQRKRDQEASSKRLAAG